MPTYVYECAKCGDEFELYQSFSDDPLKKHPGCGGKVAKVMKFTRIDDSEYSDPNDKNPRGYILRPGLLQNGGGTKVNQFTIYIVFDFTG